MRKSQSGSLPPPFQQNNKIKILEKNIIPVDFQDYSVPDFDEWFMGFVYQAARKSKDPKTKIGAVLVKNNEPIAI